MSAAARADRPTPRAIAASVALGLGLLVLVACMVQRSSGRTAVARAEAAWGEHDTQTAIAAYREAAEARCPLLCEASSAARGELARIADDAERRGDVATALSALRATRAALLSSGGAVVGSGGDDRARIERRIALLATRPDDHGALATPSSDAAREERLATALGRDPFPGTAACALFGVGSFVFLAAALRFVFARSLRVVELVVAVFGIGLAVAGLAFF